MFIEAIRPVLRRAGATEILSAGTGEEALDLARRTRPDLVLVDLGLPDRSGLAVGSDLIEALPEAKVIALTALRDPAAVREALRRGFHAYVTKDAPLPRFTASIVAALEGQVVVPSRLEALSARAASTDESARMLTEQLTSRELEVLSLLVQGCSGAQLAKRLSISKNTVRTHIQSILAKLQVHSRLEAAAFALRHGLVRPEESTPL